MFIPAFLARLSILFGITETRQAHGPTRQAEAREASDVPRGLALQRRKPLYVVARNRFDAINFGKANGYTPAEVRFICSPMQLAGMHDCRIHMLHGWTELHDARKLQDTLRVLRSHGTVTIMHEYSIARSEYAEVV